MLFGPSSTCCCCLVSSCSPKRQPLRRLRPLGHLTGRRRTRHLWPRGRRMHQRTRHKVSWWCCMSSWTVRWALLHLVTKKDAWSDFKRKVVVDYWFLKRPGWTSTCLNYRCFKVSEFFQILNDLSSRYLSCGQKQQRVSPNSCTPAASPAPRFSPAWCYCGTTLSQRTTRAYDTALASSSNSTPERAGLTA